MIPLRDLAGWLRLCWDTVKAVVKGRLEKDVAIGYRRVRQIAIDELYLGRTRKFITLVMDMESARIIWVGEGRGQKVCVSSGAASSSAELGSKRWPWT